MKCSWREGNKIKLLENSKQYYPTVFKAIGKAQEHIILETFIWFEDDISKQLHAALLAAAQHRVKAEVLLDGYSSPDLSNEFVNELTAAGMVFHYYNPHPHLFGIHTNVFHQMHHKIVVINTHITFIGRLNYSTKHMSSYSPEAKQDYTVHLEGPIVKDILQFELENLPGQSTAQHWWQHHHKAEENHQPGEAQVLLVWHNNKEHHDDIEHHYLKMLTQAQQEVIITNTYFFPSYQFLHTLHKAAHHRVQIKLIIQGKPDMPIVRVSTHLLYNYLVKGSVQVFEYHHHPLHSKVALMDNHWATVGSSNLNPLSLSLNLKANVFIHNHNFNQTLHNNLNSIITTDCQQVDETMLPKHTWWNLTKSMLAFHFLHHFPALVGWLPAHTPHLAQVDPPTQPTMETQDQVETENTGVKP